MSELLQKGECVALPTETVYGLAANALDPVAVAKIFTIKGRPLLDPLIVHVLDTKSLLQIAEGDESIEKISGFWPGPLTVVLRRKKCIPDLVTAGKETVAVRIPAHPIFRKVLEVSGLFLAAPSANPFGYVSPTRAEHVRDSLAERCPWIIDGGPCQHGLESTILDLSNPTKTRLLRPGPITLESLKEKLGNIEVVTSSDHQSAQDAPGMLERHYSPKTPVTLFERGAAPRNLSGKNAILLLSRRSPTPQAGEVFYLSEKGSIEEAAHHLFDLLRKLDAGDFTSIQVERAAPHGLGIAFNDRLTRAAAR